MKFQKIIAIVSFFICFQSNAQDKAKFSALIKQANTFLQQKDYFNASSRYSEAFTLGINISIDDRYNAAATWAMLNMIDSSFAQFNILVKDIEFTYLDDVLSDSSFTSLHSDSRWLKVLDEIKVNIKNQNQVIELKNFSDSLVYAYGILEAQNLKAKYGRLKPNIIAAATKETLRNKQQLDK